MRIAAVIDNRNGNHARCLLVISLGQPQQQ
jgi:hypothetical protein